MVYHRSSEKSSQEEVEPKNAFRNDGSFLEMFKKLQGSASSSSNSSSSTSSSSTPLPKDNTPDIKVKQEGNADFTTSSFSLLPKDNTPDIKIKQDTDNDAHFSASVKQESKPTTKPPIFGKRRGGKALPTGKVKKLKAETPEEQEEPKDAWSQYLAEVKKYKETTCEEEGKTRPLVK